MNLLTEPDEIKKWIWNLSPSSSLWGEKVDRVTEKLTLFAAFFLLFLDVMMFVLFLFICASAIASSWK